MSAAAVTILASELLIKSPGLSARASEHSAMPGQYSKHRTTAPSVPNTAEVSRINDQRRHQLARSTKAHVDLDVFKRNIYIYICVYM